MSAPKFNGKYRIPSARLKGYDYASNGAYFITICTANRYHYFGDVVNGDMVLNDVGELAQKYWDAIPQQFPFMKLDVMVVMPNHVHGVLWIDQDNVDRDAIHRASNKMDAIHRVSNKTDVINHVSTGGATGKNNPMFYKNISRVIRWYKGRCTFEINKTYPKIDFKWQPRFHDHIIRDEKSLGNIQNYILNNPVMWDRDRNNKEGLWL